MSLVVACNTCRKTFEASLHAGLVRCDACAQATAFRLPASRPHTVVL